MKPKDDVIVADDVIAYATSGGERRRAAANALGKCTYVGGTTHYNKGFKYTHTLRFPVVSVQKRKQLRAHVSVLDHRQRLWVCNRCCDVDRVGGVNILGVWPEVDLRRVSCDLNAKLLFMPLSVSGCSSPNVVRLTPLL